MEIISLNFGQCGFQLADVYWTQIADMIKNNEKDRKIYESLYKNSDNAQLNSSNPNYKLLIPRCILVDTEMGPATQIMQETQNNLISTNNIIAGTDAAGNNWATAFKEYGSKYSETIEELVTNMLEDCDHPEYFNLVFGITGGTGSGLGTFSSQLLYDLYPKIPQVSNIVASDNLSAVSPYNNLLALNKLEEYSKLIIPFSIDLILENMKAKGLTSKTETEKQKTYFGPINTLISEFMHKFNIMTVDPTYDTRVNSIINSLTPIEKLNYTSPFKSPIKGFSEKDTNNLENIYNDLFRPMTRICPIPQESTMSPLAISIFTNGELEHLKYIKALKLRQKMLGWNRDAVKVNLKHPFSDKGSSLFKDNSIMALSNHTGIAEYLDSLCEKVETLLKKKAFLHHFSNLVDEQEIRNTMDKILHTSQEYKSEDNQINSVFKEVIDYRIKNKNSLLEIPEIISNAWPFNMEASTVI